LADLSRTRGPINRLKGADHASAYDSASDVAGLPGHDICACAHPPVPPSGLARGVRDAPSVTSWRHALSPRRRYESRSMVDHVIPTAKRAGDGTPGAQAPQVHRERAHLAAVRDTGQGLRGRPQPPSQVTFAGGSGSKGPRLSRQQSPPWHAEGSDPVPPVAPEPRTCPCGRMPFVQASADGFAATATGAPPADMPGWHDHSHATAALLEAPAGRESRARAHRKILGTQPGSLRQVPGRCDRTSSGSQGRNQAMSSTSPEATAAQPPAAHPFRRIVNAIGAWRETISDRVHAEEEGFCAQVMGWIVTRGTGRFGFGTRTYRDLRMDSLAAHGKAPRNGVQITHPATITVRGRA
jgi:hypothetical protein